MSICGLIAAFVIFPGEFWVIPGTIILVDSFAPLRRAAKLIAAALLVVAVGRMTLLALSLVPGTGWLAADRTPAEMAVLSLATGLLTATVADLGGRAAAVVRERRQPGGSGRPTMSEAESNSVFLMRLITAAAFFSFWDPGLGADKPGLGIYAFEALRKDPGLGEPKFSDVGLLYLSLIAAARSWPRAASVGVAFVGVFVVIVGSAFLFLAMLGQSVSMHIDGGAEIRRTNLHTAVTLLLHWAMIGSAIWRFVTRSKRARVPSGEPVTVRCPTCGTAYPSRYYLKNEGCIGCAGGNNR